jgi:hypothetical protein
MLEGAIINCVRLSECENKELVLRIFSNAMPYGKGDSNRLIISTDKLSEILQEYTDDGFIASIALGQFRSSSDYTMFIHDL